MKVASNSATVILAGIVVLLACDPGYNFQPSGWERDGDGGRRTDTPTFTVRMGPPGGLIGDTWISPEPEFSNHDSDPLVIVGATLAANGQQWEAELPGHADPKWRTVPAGGTRRVGLWFDLGKPVFEALGDAITVRILYRRGDGPTEALEVICNRE